MSIKEIAPAGDMCIVRTFQNGKSSENVAKKKAPKQRLPLNGSHTNYLVLFLLLVLALWLAKNIHFKWIINICIEIKFSVFVYSEDECTRECFWRKWNCIIILSFFGWCFLARLRISAFIKVRLRFHHEFGASDSSQKSLSMRFVCGKTNTAKSRQIKAKPTYQISIHSSFQQNEWLYKPDKD